jgi:PAS domain-containing protein
MIRRYFIVALAALVAASSVAPARAFEFNPNYVISDAELLDEDSMTLEQIRAFLGAYGTLGERTFVDVDDERKEASEIIYDAARRNGISPRVILVMLQKEQSLIDDRNPDQSQLDWAMGYGICDSCNHETESAQRFRGFAKQVNSATLQLSEGYMADLAARGRTTMGYGPGIEATIDDARVVFANAATAALYTYTPHTHGNSNFAKLWQRWFTHDYPDGTLLQNSEDGGVWLVRHGYRRPITSRAALLTRFNENAIVPVDPTALAVYPIGKPISLPNYSLLRSPRGTVYLLVDDTLRGIASQEAFRAIGFNPDEILDVTFEDLAAYEEGESITTDTVYPQGALLQDTTTGGVYHVQNGEKSPIMSREILAARFPSAAIRPAEAGELPLYPTSTPVLFPDGTLISAEGRPDVYAVSGGYRRPILNEATFDAYGWQWTQVVKTNARSVEIHPLGQPVSASDENEAGTESKTI